MTASPRRGSKVFELSEGGAANSEARKEKAQCLCDRANESGDLLGQPACPSVHSSLSNWSKFVERKIATAVMLNDGECNGSYSDGCVLLSALISGIAAELWPGNDRIDRVRFVELWAGYCDKQLRPAFISVPFLRQFLRRSGRAKEAKILEGARPKMFGLGHSTLVLRGVDVDMREAELVKLPIGLTVKQLREHSYPAIFYKHVRSNLAHEYKLSDDAASHFATRLEADVSYVNRHDPDEPDLSRRLIHFHMGWLASITRSIVSNVADLVENYQTLPRPSKWWLHG